MKTQIVVVGGGAGGLELVTRLGDRLARRGRAEVTLIDRARTHLWKPLLHEVAAGSLDIGVHELAYLAQSHWHRFTFRVGEMVGLDRARREVLVAPWRDDEGIAVTPARRIPYDTLVIAIGSQTHDFGTPGVRERSTSVTRARPLRPSLSPSRVASSRPPAPPPTMTMLCGSAMACSSIHYR